MVKSTRRVRVRIDLMVEFMSEILAEGQTHGDVLRQLIGEAFPASEENSHETA